jgi:hypothetical protein
MNEQADRVAELEALLRKYEQGDMVQQGRLYSSSLSDKANDKSENRVSDLLEKLNTLERLVA